MVAEFGSIEALAEIGVFQKLLAAYQRVYPGVVTCAATMRLNAAVADASFASPCRTPIRILGTAWTI